MGQADQYGWNPIQGKWLPIPASCPSIRKVAVGQVYAAPCKLHWVIVNPSAPNALLELTDALAALGAVTLDFFQANKNTLVFTMQPAKRFEVGIYLETFTNLTSVIFGYTPD